MASRNNTPLVGWHPRSADLVAWLETEVERRGGGRGIKSDILDEALAEYIARRDGTQPAATTAVTTPAQPAPVVFVAAEDDPPQQPRKNCKHRNMRGHKGVCPDCQQWAVKQ